jgi:hypothetical protein
VAARPIDGMGLRRGIPSCSADQRGSTRRLTQNFDSVITPERRIKPKPDAPASERQTRSRIRQRAAINAAGRRRWWCSLTCASGYGRVACARYRAGMALR